MCGNASPTLATPAIVATSPDLRARTTGPKPTRLRALCMGTEFATMPELEENQEPSMEREHFKFSS